MTGVMSAIGIYQQAPRLVAAILCFMDRVFVDRQASASERRKARDLAQAVLDGRMTVLEGARALVSLAHTDAVPDLEDRKLIIAVESETDDLPVGEVRTLWATDMLKEKDVEIARAEKLYRDSFLQACQRIAIANCSSDNLQ